MPLMNLSDQTLENVINAVEEARSSAEECTDNFPRDEGDEYNKAGWERMDTYDELLAILEQFKPAPVEA